MLNRLTSSFRMFGLFLAALLIGFHFQWLNGSLSYYQSDLTYYFEPFTEFVATAYAAGKLPLWNPYLYCGMAQAAVPSPGMFYPPMTLFVWMPFSQALAVFLVLHQLLAGCGAYLLVASLGWGALAAAVCGFAVALSGYMFALTANYTLVATISWFPLLLFFVRSIDNTWTRVNIVRMFGASVSMFGMLAAGRPEVFVPAALTVGIYIVVTAYGAYREDNMLRQASVQAGLRILSLFAGCLLALPVILPAIEWVRLSPRSKGLELKWVLMWSANWYDCLNMIVAQPLGDITALGSKYLNLVASRSNALPYVTSSYVGPVVFSFAMWSLFDKRWRWRFVVLAFLLAGLLMALGQYTPVAPFICKLSPAFASFRYPVKLTIFPLLALCFMAARGANLTIDRELPRRALILAAVIWSAMLLVGLAFLNFPQLAKLTGHFPWFAGKVVNYQVMSEAQWLFGKSLAITGGLGLLVCANYIAYVREQLTRELFAFLTGGTLLLTLFMPAVAYQRHGAAADFYHRPHPLVGKLQSAVKGSGEQRFASRVQPLYHDPLTPGQKFLERNKLPYEYGFYLFTRELVLPNTNVGWGIPYAFGYEAAEEGFYKHLFADALSTSSQNRKRPATVPINDVPVARFCQIASVSQVLTQAYIGDKSRPLPDLNRSLFTLVEDNPGDNYRIWKTKNHFARAYFADHIVWNATDEQVKKQILDKSTSALLASTYVSGVSDKLVESDTSRGKGADAKIEFIADQNEHVVMRTEFGRVGLLVLTDRLYPGWTATLDGQPVEMRKVNGFARGVVVPAGAHTIEYRYSPWSVWAGLIATALVLLGYCCVFLGSRKDSARVPALETWR